MLGDGLPALAFYVRDDAAIAFRVIIFLARGGRARASRCRCSILFSQHQHCSIKRARLIIESLVLRFSPRRLRHHYFIFSSGIALFHVIIHFHMNASAPTVFDVVCSHRAKAVENILNAAVRNFDNNVAFSKFPHYMTYYRTQKRLICREW